MLTKSHIAGEGSIVRSVRTGGTRRSYAIAQLSTGVALPYVEQGRRDGVPVVLLHGYTDSLRSYEPVLAHLPESVRAFALTHRGHGDADRPEGGYRIADLADDVRAWMDCVGLQSAVIVGHSLSAHVAQRFAAEYPERTRALVLVGAFLDFASNAGVVELGAEVARLSDPVDRQFVRAFQESTLAQPVPPGFLDLVVHESCKLPARVWKALADGFMASNLSAERARIASPTLIVWGVHDALITRSDQDELLRAIHGSALLEYPNAGHALHWEEPERFAADLAAFVQRVA